MRRYRARSLIAGLLIAVVTLVSADMAAVPGSAETLRSQDTTPGQVAQSDNRVESKPVSAATYPDVGSVTALAFEGALAWIGTADGRIFHLDTATPDAQPAPLPVPYPVHNVPIRSLVRDARGDLWAATEGGGLGRLDARTYKWQVFDPSNSNFPSKNVRAVALDPAERVWAATDAGAAMYDGARWVTYNRRNSGLPSNNVTALLPVSATWIGTDAGLARLQDGQWKVIQATNSALPDNRITALAQDHHGSLWVGTESGVFKTPGNLWRNYLDSYYYAEGSTWTRFGAVSDPIRGLAIDAGDRVWLNLGDRLGRLSDCGLTPYDAAALEPVGSTIATMALDPLGRLWAGGDSGLARLPDRGDATAAAWTPTGISQPVRALALDGGQVWAALEGGAVVHLDPATGEQSSIADLKGEPRGATVDAQGRLWVGAWGQGAAVYDRDRWARFTHAQAGLPSDFVNGLALAPDGTLWAATSSGVAALDGQTQKWRAVAAFDRGGDGTGLNSGPVLAVAAATDGRMAFGTYGDGVTVYDGTDWAAFNTANSALPSNYIPTVAFDAEGRLWAGTQGSGAARFDGKSWTTHRAGVQGPTSDFISALTVDSAGHVWTGAPDGGLAEFDGCNWTHYAAAAADLPGGVTALASDPDGTLWVGGSSGLFELKPATAGEAAIPAEAQRALKAGPVRATAPQAAVSQSLPGTDRWISHAVGRSAHSFAFSGEDVWEATLGGGLLRWRPADGRFTRFQFPQDGLPSNRIVFVAVDAQQRVWAATQDRGVAVYDGRHWTTYDTRNSGLSFDDVNGIAFDSKGRAWLATLGGGVCLFDGQKWTVYKENSGLAGDQVWYVAVDAQDRVWAGTVQGLSVFDGKRWSTFPKTQNVHCVAFDAQGRTWFGDGYGLNRVDGQKVTPIRTGEYEPWTKDVYSIQFDAQGAAWLGTGAGIFRYDGQSFSHIATATTGLYGNQVYAVGVDPSGGVWFGTDGEDGAARYDGADWQTFHTSSGPNPVSGSVQHLFVDRQGRVWLGGARGLSAYDGRGWIGYTAANSGLAADDIRGITQAPDGRLWLATLDGISVFDGVEGWQTIRASAGGLLDNAVHVVRFDAQGRAWIGTEQGLSVFDGQGWRSFTEANTGIDLRSIQDLAFDLQGRVWVISSVPDIDVLSGDRWTKVTREEYGISTFSLHSIAVDPGGRVWLGTFDGLTMFDGKKWTVMRPFPKEAGGFAPFDIAFDAQGQPWVGGYKGLAHLDKGKWVTYTAGDSPLLDGSVSAVAVDPKGRVWLGTSDYGVTELTPGTQRFPMPATATPTPTMAPAVAPPTVTPAAKATAAARATTRPVTQPTPTPRPQANLQAPAPRFAQIWEDVYGGNRGGLKYAVAPAVQIGCADERFEHGLMFWRNNVPMQAVIYVLMYGADTESGSWQAFADEWTAGLPDKGGFTPPAGLLEPVRGFGTVWRGRLGGGPNPPAIGWAVEPEQGLSQAEYQDFQGGTLLYSPRLKRVFVLKSDGGWRAFGSE